MKLQYNEQKSSDNLAWFTAELPICNIHVYEDYDIWQRVKWYWKLWPMDISSEIAVSYASKETAYISAIANVRQLAYDLLNSCDKEVKEVMKK